MKARSIIVIIAVIALVAAAILVRNRPQQGEADAPPKAADATGILQFRMEQQWLIHLKLALAEESHLSPQIYSTGRVIASPANRALVAPPVGGIVENRPLPRIGQRVTRGELMATLIQTPTAAEAAQIRIENSRVDAERRRLAQSEIEARARLAAAAAEAERARRLLEKKAYSERQFEMAEADRKAAEATLMAVQEQMKALQTAPMTSAYEVTAPISGIVAEVRKAAGEEVHPGEPILEIVALETVWVEAPIFEKDLGRLAKDINATLTTPAYPGKEFHGRLVNIGAIVDEQTRAAKAVFEVNNASGELRLGMQANVRLAAGTPMDGAQL